MQDEVTERTWRVEFHPPLDLNEKTIREALLSTPSGRVVGFTLNGASLTLAADEASAVWQRTKGLL